MSDALKVANERLLFRKAQLDEQSALSKEARAAVQLDQQSVGRLSRMDAMQMQEMANAQERQRAIELQRVIAALARLEDDPDEYGYCAECGAPIPDKRLDIDPAATHCVSCAGR